MKIHEKRINEVLHYIDQNLASPLTLDVLSNQACCSKFHFHRYFKAMTGVTAFKYVQQQRLKWVANSLVFRPEKSILEIALDAGFEGNEAMSRLFKQHLGQSPREYRQNPQESAWLTRPTLTHSKDDLMIEVEIVTFNATTLAVLEHKGSPANIPQTLAKFIAWRKQQKLSPQKSRTFNLYYDDPTMTNPDEYRFDVGAEIKQPLGDNDAGIVTKVIPTGRCAFARVFGPWHQLEHVVDYLYGTWLAQSNEQLRDFPCFVERVNLYPAVPESELITDVYLPII